MTASITMLPEITIRMRAPRALAVPYPLGYPLGAPNDPVLQTAILRELLDLCDETTVPRLTHSVAQLASPSG